LKVSAQVLGEACLPKACCGAWQREDKVLLSDGREGGREGGEDGRGLRRQDSPEQAWGIARAFAVGETMFILQEVQSCARLGVSTSHHPLPTTPPNHSPQLLPNTQTHPVFTPLSFLIKKCIHFCHALVSPLPEGYKDC
jgi:hypothetical protein